LIEIINKPLLLHLVGYLYYWQMGFNSVFKGLKVPCHNVLEFSEACTVMSAVAAAFEWNVKMFEITN